MMDIAELISRVALLGLDILRIFFLLGLHRDNSGKLATILKTWRQHISKTYVCIGCYHTGNEGVTVDLGEVLALESRDRVELSQGVVLDHLVDNFHGYHKADIALFDLGCVQKGAFALGIEVVILDEECRTNL
jgi:hypothetical protein